MFLSVSCNHHEIRDEYADLIIRLNESGMTSRTMIPDEDIVNKITAFIYNESGELEAAIDGNEKEMKVRLMKKQTYSILTVANIDKSLNADNLEDMMAARYRMDSPYDYADGIAMSAAAMNIYMDEDRVIDISLERLMAKVNIRIDRSRLNEGTAIKVNKVKVGNCPSCTYIFQPNRINQPGDCFDIGFEREDTESLNSSDSYGMSDEISIYLLENMQGQFSMDGPDSETDKIFDADDQRRLLCSYIELEMEYHSDSLFCTDEPLIYRFYIGDGLNSLNVERNCNYHITVLPDGDGLCEDIWRIEKGGLHSYVQEIILSEETILLDYMGKSIKLEAEVFPIHAYNNQLIWYSSDPQTAYVDQTGNVTAINEGECRIICSSTDGSGTASSCLVRNEFAPPRLISYPENKYINGDIGDTVRLWCDIFPPDTPFDIGLEYLEDDKKAGVYDYIIDEDGHGVTLTLTGPGTGLIYMEAFGPINDAALYFIEVNLPENTSTENSYSR